VHVVHPAHYNQSVSRLLLASTLLVAALQAAPVPQEPLQQPPATNTTPDKPVTPVVPDPALVNFTTDIGMLMVAVKPAMTADYEAALALLQKALSESKDEGKRALAKGWRVLKAADLDAKSNAIYIHFVDPAITGADYRPSILLDELIDDAPGEVLAKYRDSIAAGPNRLSLVEFARMSEPPKPANATPTGPAPPAKPGNGSPFGPQQLKR
jgi:hypothetical protein